MAFLKKIKNGDKTYIYVAHNNYSQGKSDQIILARLGIESELKECFGKTFDELQNELKDNQTSEYYKSLETRYQKFRTEKRNKRKMAQRAAAKAARKAARMKKKKMP